MPISYLQAGVDIDAGDRLIDRIKPFARATRIDEVVSDVGGFAGLCRVPANVADPVLVAGTDGVGTKLKVAFETGVHNTVGIDLVAMCVNDVLTIGARPLFFLDYFASGKLDVDVAASVISGIADGCKLAGCALLGGETAELPGMYKDGEYDLAGFAVGVVAKSGIIDGSRAKAGDAIIALPSSGLHSNGYSLARRVFHGAMGLGVTGRVAELGCSAGEALLVPTRIYASAVSALLGSNVSAVRALCHITGGGIPGNLPRVLPDGLGAKIDLASYERPAIFRVMAKGGPVEESEMRRVFNLGVGLMIVMDRSHVDDALARLGSAGEKPWVIGEVAEVPADTPFESRVTF
jgi:phosphoribosylformylglycinamidine cyclo-ligase